MFCPSTLAQPIRVRLYHDSHNTTEILRGEHVYERNMVAFKNRSKKYAPKIIQEILIINILPASKAGM